MVGVCCKGKGGREVGGRVDRGGGDADEVGRIIEEGGFRGDYWGVFGYPGAVGGDGGWRGGRERAS